MQCLSNFMFNFFLSANKKRGSEANVVAIVVSSPAPIPTSVSDTPSAVTIIAPATGGGGLKSTTPSSTTTRVRAHSDVSAASTPSESFTPSGEYATRVIK